MCHVSFSLFYSLKWYIVLEENKVLVQYNIQQTCVKLLTFIRAVSVYKGFFFFLLPPPTCHIEVYNSVQLILLGYFVVIVLT